ncbi:MAG TPA: GNAT family N-acetyltransferase/peptidase C39 family protein [Gammaproteobacteria bacterium]|nr:GNAT family N-acetyltransferase/peptidase C39 family protein [Gammaproteobacteria bacterium]
MIREATRHDIDALLDIENRCFSGDKLSRRRFRYLLTQAHAVTLAEQTRGTIRGYAMVLFNAATSHARLYSLAVDPAHQGHGIATTLLAASEQCAVDHECISLRLEIRHDNSPSIQLFLKSGYRQFGVIDDYYEDHMSALRFEKTLAPHLQPDMVSVPYYRQTLEFTCGPAALMMAMKSLDPELALERKLELRIWRESTTIFMAAGHGGCGPYGLALSAYHRGFDVEIYVNDTGALFIDSVRNPRKKDVIRLVQEDFEQELQDHGIPVFYESLHADAIQEKFDQGGIPVVLISSYRIYGEKEPHWVVVTGFDEHYIYVHDPFVDSAKGKTPLDCINMPILKKDFERMARYGKAGQKAVIILKERPAQAGKKAMAAR